MTQPRRRVLPIAGKVVGKPLVPANVYDMIALYTLDGHMRTNIDIDDTLMAAAQKASGQPTKKQTVEHALRLLIKLRGQEGVKAAFGKYRWSGDLARSRRGRGA